jgi:hypothetical protein
MLDVPSFLRFHRVPATYRGHISDLVWQVLPVIAAGGDGALDAVGTTAE